MIKYLTFLLAMLFSSVAYAAAGTPVQCTYNLETKYIDPKTNEDSTGRGVAVAVDMSKYGLKGSKYLLTAWHLLNYDKPTIFLELPIGKIRCTIITKDEALDIAIIECQIDAPFVAELDSTNDLALKTPLVNVGSPDSIGPASGDGELTEKTDFKWVASAKNFYHGSSGGAEFHDGKYFGLCVSGQYDEHDPGFMRRGIAIFVPLKRIKSFLRDYQDEQTEITNKLEAEKKAIQDKIDKEKLEASKKLEADRKKDGAEATPPDVVPEQSKYLSFTDIQKALKEGRMPFCQCLKCLGANGGMSPIGPPKENPF